MFSNWAGRGYRQLLDRTTIIVLTMLRVTGHTQGHNLSGFTHTAAVVLSGKDSRSGEKSQRHGAVYLEHRVADKQQNDPQLVFLFCFVRELSST